MFNWFKKRRPTPTLEHCEKLASQALQLHKQGDLAEASRVYGTLFEHGAALDDTLDAAGHDFFRDVQIGYALCRSAGGDPIGAADILTCLKEDGLCSPDQSKNVDGLLAKLSETVPYRDRVQLYRQYQWNWRAEGRDPSEICATLSNEAVARLQRGDAPGAQTLWERIELVSRQIPSWVGVTTAMRKQAEIHALRGDQARSVALLREAFDHTGLEVFFLGGDTKFDEQAPERPIHAINLRETKINDGNLVLLRNTPHLRELNLAETDITDVGLEHLSHVKHLTQLLLELTLVTDRGLRHLQHLGELQMLFLGGTKITDHGLALLQPLQQLEVLILGGTEITDAGLVQLRALPKLWNIDLRDTSVSDAGLEVLKGMKQIRKLNLIRTRVTPEGIDRAGAAWPDLKDNDLAVGN